MSYRLQGCILASVILLTSSSFAATVDPAQGTLYISTGQGFQTVGERIDAKVGDTFMVSPGGVAMVTYPDGCRVAIQPGQVTTITSASPCRNPYPPNNNNQAVADPPDYTIPLIGAAALGAAGVGLGIYAITQNHQSSNTTVNAMNCGSIGNPCWISVSP